MTEAELEGFTPTERKILAVLADGERHSRTEFHEPLGMVVTEKGDDASINKHIWNMREKLRPLGKWVVSEYHMYKYYYRLVNLVKPTMPIS